MKIKMIVTLKMMNTFMCFRCKYSNEPWKIRYFFFHFDQISRAWSIPIVPFVWKTIEIEISFLSSKAQFEERFFFIIFSNMNIYDASQPNKLAHVCVCIRIKYAWMPLNSMEWRYFDSNWKRNSMAVWTHNYVMFW